MKSLYFSLIFILVISISLQGQILNGGFEQWVSGEPVNWTTNNSNLLFPVTPITQTSDAHSGALALKGEVVPDPLVPQFTISPTLSAGSIFSGGISFSGQPKQIRGYYKFNPVGGDAFRILILLFNETNLIGIGGRNISTPTGPDYQEMVIDIVYSDTVTIPNRMQFSFDIVPIVISQGNLGSWFYIDDFPTMSLIKPPDEPENAGTGNLVFIAGETDTIKWNSGGALNVNIEYSVDNGATYQQIVSNFPADSSRYFWAVPGSLLTREAKIRLIESQNTNNKKKSINFSIKPWQLTRIDANDKFELFEPNQDGWSFANIQGNMWPASWWQQFSYKPPATDPYTNVIYPNFEPFRSALQMHFPDWPLFVEVFGVDQSYTSINNASYSPSATGWWKSVDSGVWSGSCFGFSVTSLVAFYYKNIFLIKYPQIGQYNRLNSLSLNDDRRKVINGFYMRQYDLLNLNYRKARKNTVTARQTLAELKDMFRNENGDGKPLALYSQTGSGGHSVTPYKLVRSGTSTFDLLVYDNEAPNTFQVITIDSLTDRWFDQTTANLGSGKTGIFLELPSAYYLLSNPVIPPPLLAFPFLPLKNQISNGLSGIIVLNTPNADILISSASGNQIGYQDSVEFSNIVDGISIIPLTGGFQPPTGYYIPQDQYSLQLKKITDSLSFVFFITDSTLYNYRRYGPNNDEIDLLNFAEDGIGITNPDPIVKAINFESIILEDSTSAKIFVTDNVQISSGDSIHFQEKDRNELLLQNYGESMSYDLQTRIVSESGQAVFFHMAIPMDQNSAHQIVPDWNDLVNTPITIYIDLGNDGTIDDSLEIKNQITNVEDQGNLYIPKEYKLEQNYPNPFNPATIIKYQIPELSFVTLKVYDVLGNEIAALVNEEKPTGNYEIEFNGNELTSGVYFYRLQVYAPGRAGSFVETKKMILLR